MTARASEPNILTAGVLRNWPLPSQSGDKESRGRLLIVGGSRTTPGAVLLAAEAALRAGAGKVQIATAASVAVGLALRIPEAMVVGLPEDINGDIDVAAAERIVELAADCRVVLVGPGMSTPAAAADLLEQVIPKLTATLVVDALGMAYLTGRLDGVRHLDGRAVLTPNLSELAHTLEISSDHVEQDERSAAERLAVDTGAVVISGGETSWIVAADGESWRDDSGGPGMGSAGSGDVKAGVVAGLAVRGGEPAQAAVWATYLHGRAGERLAERVGTVGYLAREMIAEIPRALSELGSH